METTILTVMVGLAAVGFGVLGLMWLSLDRRMDRLEGRMDRLEGVRETDRREVLGMLIAQARQLGRIEGHLGIAHDARGDPPQGPEAAAAV